jgi:hypothetical protein
MGYDQDSIINNRTLENLNDLIIWCVTNR